MRYYEISPVGVVRADSAIFTYSSNDILSRGQIVEIQVGKKTFVGVTLREITQPSFATKSILSTVETRPLPESLVLLAEWLSEYYATHLGTVWQTILPRGLTKKRRTRTQQAHVSRRERTHFLLNEAQKAAVNTVETMNPGTALLHGVTGSGKTAVYIELARQMQSQGKSTIILVPEIALTSQLIDEFSHHFSELIVTHSKQTEAERHTLWQQALHSSTPQIVIGPRSALFAPLDNIGLIVIDESHEPSFKQEQSPRYSALRAASTLAGLVQAKLVLGSATPSVQDYYLATQMRRPIISLPSPARRTTPPKISLIDMTKRAEFTRHRFFSKSLLEQIESTLASGKQVLLFHNRRGSATVTLCEVCGWQATCPTCFVPLTLHADLHELRCHICGRTERVPTSCPVCAHVGIIHKGIGTKLIESEIRRLFPQYTVGRFDGDTADADSVERQYKALYDGSINVLIGTQVIAKGLDLPHLRTVGIVQADAGLSLPDYSASERTFQLLAQAIGRVGRNEHETSVIVQSYQPNHPAVTLGLTQNYAEFYQHTLRERQRAHFPPYVFLLKLTCVYKTEAAAVRNAQKLAQELRKVSPETVQILGPTPSFYERQHNTYRWQLVLKSPQRTELVKLLSYVPSQHWQTELDPVSLL